MGQDGVKINTKYNNGRNNNYLTTTTAGNFQLDFEKISNVVTKNASHCKIQSESNEKLK